MENSIAKTSNRLWQWSVPVLGAGALLCAGILPAQNVEEERAALVSAKAEATAANSRAAALEAKAAAEQGQAKKAQLEAAAVASRIQSAEAEISAAEARVKLIDSMQSDLRARLAEKQQPAVRLVAVLQSFTRRPPALAIVQPGSLRDMVHARAVMDNILPEIGARTSGLRADLARQRQLRADAAQAVAALASGRKRLDQERLALVQTAARHRAEAQGFAGSAVAEQERAMAMGERARDIVDLIGQIGADADVRARLETLPGPVLRPGNPGAARTLPETTQAGQGNKLPYLLPVAGTVVTGLGEVSLTGVRARGLTLATRPNAQVVAPASGRIVFAGDFRSFGRIVIIDHGQGWTTLITGLDVLDVSVGDGLAQGGPVGRTGAGKPQVTIELRRNMRPIDIAWLLG